MWRFFWREEHTLKYWYTENRPTSSRFNMLGIMIPHVISWYLVVHHGWSWLIRLDKHAQKFNAWQCEQRPWLLACCPNFNQAGAKNMNSYEHSWASIKIYKNLNMHNVVRISLKINKNMQDIRQQPCTGMCWYILVHTSSQPRQMPYRKTVYFCIVLRKFTKLSVYIC